MQRRDLPASAAALPDRDVGTLLNTLRASGLVAVLSAEPRSNVDLTMPHLTVSSTLD